MWIPGQGGGLGGGGGPLLTLGELLEDLEAEERAQSKEHDIVGANQAQAVAAPSSELMENPRSLQFLFERTFTQLNVALAHAGHAWPGLTQKLCSALAIADNLVAVARTSLIGLSQQVTGLMTMMERFAGAAKKLQAAIETTILESQYTPRS